MLFANILVTTDLSEESCQAFEIALYQARQYEAHLTLLAVFENFQIPAPLQKQFGGPAQMAQLEEEYRQKCRDKLEPLYKRYFHDSDVKIVAIFSDKSAAEEIISYIEKNGVGLLVISNRGHSKVSELFLGNTTQEILRRVSCPVLVIPSIASLR